MAGVWPGSYTGTDLKLPPQYLSRSINLLQLPHQPPYPCSNICWAQWISHKSLTAPVENRLKAQRKPHTCKSVIWQPAKFVSSAKKEKQPSFSIFLNPRLTASWGLPLLHTYNITSAPTGQLWQQNGLSFCSKCRKMFVWAPRLKWECWGKLWWFTLPQGMNHHLTAASQSCCQLFTGQSLLWGFHQHFSSFKWRKAF